MSSTAPAGFHNFEKSIPEGMKSINEAYTKNPSLHSGQKPARAYVYCSDSRDPIEQICNVGPGVVFGYRNIGNSLEQQGDVKSLSQDAINWLTYAAHIGVREFVILGHGGCGCMKNAYACNCVADNHGHGHGMEADILGTMGKSKRFATELVKAADAVAYLTKLGLPTTANAADNHVRAITIAHAFYQQKLAQDFFAKLEADYEKQHGHALEGGPIKVKVEYFELETTPCALYAYCDSDQKFYNAGEKSTECCCKCGCAG